MARTGAGPGVSSFVLRKGLFSDVLRWKMDDQQGRLIGQRPHESPAIRLNVDELEGEIEEIFLPQRAEDQARNRHV
jgi:hypothetical protein